jgi:polysaccharide biosynthesis transport protein
MSQAAYMQGAAASADRGEIDLSALFREVGRRKWLILAVTLAAAVLSTITVSILSPRYTAETRILVENRDTEYTRFGRDGQRGNDPTIDQEQVTSQVQLVTSRDLARRMIEKFDLGSKREFDKVIDGIGVPARILVMLGLIDNPANVSPQERVLESYYDKLKAFAVTRSRVLSIEFQSRDPELAAQLANAIAEEYIRQLESAKKGTAQNAGGWLQRTIEPLRRRVAEAEAKAEAFRSQNGLFQSGENTTIPQQQLSELNTLLATARAQQAELTSKARLIREAVRQGRIFEVSEVINNEVVRRLIERRAELKAQVAQEERTLLPQHPRIRELNAQLAGMEEQVRAAADRAARAMENDARAAGARVAASQGELDQQKRATGTASEAEVQLRVLEREAKAEREQLENYLSRYRDASVRDLENAVAADARIVSRATVPSAPTFPKRLPIIIISTLAAFTLVLFLVLTRALLSDAIYTVRPIVEAAPTPMAGMAPYPMVTPQMMQAFYAQQAAMMAQMAQPQPAHAAPQPAPAADPPAPIPVMQPEPDPLQVSLDRMRASLKDRASAAAAVAAQPAVAIVHDAPSMAEESAGGYDALGEIAEAADAAKMRGRPVGILVLSALDASFAEGSAQALVRKLAALGSVQHMALDASARSAASIADIIRGLSGQHDFVVVNGGAADGRSADLAKSAVLTVLVAPEDVLDPRIDEASRNLAGCNYFIVGPAARVATSA